MSDENLPAKPIDPRFDQLPEPLAHAYAESTPMQQMLGEVFNELGGTAALADWAEENMGEFVRIVMAANPTPMATPTTTAGGDGGVHIHLPEALGPGPLDVVSEQ